MAREHYWPSSSKAAQDQEKRALAAEHDRQVRHRSMANDMRLDLPVSISRPDGEEYPARTRLRSHDKRYEIQKPYIQGPPNKTVWDSIDCLERTVTQPSSSSSSSSRPGGNKSASKSSSSHWGLSWSRSNKSPPSQGRTSRGQSRHASSNPSTSVRNPPCETARGKYGGGNGGGGGVLHLAGPLLSAFIPSTTSSPAAAASSLGTIPHSSPLGFHGAATSLIAGDTVHIAFANHNHHHHHPHIPSASHQQQQHHHHHHPPPTILSRPPQQDSLVFSGLGGEGSGVEVPSGGKRCSSEKDQEHETARTSPNNNSSSSSPLSPSPPTSVLQRLIDPEMKLFSRNSSACSKESRRSNNNANNNSNHGKNGKSHRTDQSMSAASSSASSSMATDNINPSCSSRRGTSRTANMCVGPSTSSTPPRMERMLTTEDSYCCGAGADTDDDGAIHYARCSSSDMKDGDVGGCLTFEGQGQQGVMGSDTNTTLKLSPQQPPFNLSSPPTLSFNSSQHVRMSSSVPTASPMFNCNNFSKNDATGGTGPSPDPTSCLVSERKRNLHEPFSSSGYTTDPNYSTFASNKMMIGSSCRNNNSPPSPSPCSGNSASCSGCSSSSASIDVQSQYGFVVGGGGTEVPANNPESPSTMDTSADRAKLGKETAHYCELSETFIASNKNAKCTDPDQYCTAAELTISSSSPLQTRNNNGERGTPTSSASTSSSSQSSSSALSLVQSDNQTSSPASP